MIIEYFKKLPFYEKTWFQFILFVLRRFEADRCREQAGSLTYTTLFAVVPMLTVFLVIISSRCFILNSCILLVISHEVYYEIHFNCYGSLFFNVF